MLKHALYFLLPALMIIILLSGCTEWVTKQQSGIYYDASYDFEVEKIWFDHGSIIMLPKSSDTVYVVWEGSRGDRRTIDSFVSVGSRISKNRDDSSLAVTLSNGETRVFKYDLRWSSNKNRYVLYPFE